VTNVVVSSAARTAVAARAALERANVAPEAVA
jgi:hypothetical protein